MPKQCGTIFSANGSGRNQPLVCSDSYVKCNLKKIKNNENSWIERNLHNPHGYFTAGTTSKNRPLQPFKCWPEKSGSSRFSSCFYWFVAQRIMRCWLLNCQHISFSKNLALLILCGAAVLPALRFYSWIYNFSSLWGSGCATLGHVITFCVHHRLTEEDQSYFVNSNTVE